MTQVFPAIEGFGQHGFTIPADFWWCRYMGIKPTLDASGIDAYQSGTFLSDAFQAYSGQGGFQAANAVSLGGDTGKSYAVQSTHRCSDDVKVSGTFRFIPISGTFAPQFPTVGSVDSTSRAVEIFAYISAGAPVLPVDPAVDSTRDMYVTLPDCYRLRFSSIGATSLVWQVGRYNVGVFTALDAAVISYDGWDTTAPLTITLAVAQSGANNELTCTYSGMGQPETTLTSAFSDTSPLRPTYHFAGFGDGGVYTNDQFDSGATPKVAVAWEVFQIENQSSGSVVEFRDEFERHDVGFQTALPMGSTSTPNGTVTGYAVSGMFGWDAYSFSVDDDSLGIDGSGPILAHVSGQDYVKINMAAAVSNERHEHLLISRIPPTDLRSQHRAALVQFEATPTQKDVRAGICLRSAQSFTLTSPGATAPHALGSYGYIAYWISALLLPTLRIQRLNNGIPVTLGEYFDSYSSPVYWPGVGLKSRVDFEVYTAASSTVEGPVVLTLKIDGVQVTGWDNIGSSHGATVDGLGTITDNSSDRILSGGEGLYHSTNYATTLGIRYYSWEQKGLTSVSGGTAPQDQVGIAIGGEGTAVGSLNTVLDPDFPFRTEYQTPTRRYPFDSGHVETGPRFLVLGADTIRSRKLYTFQASGVSQTELDAFLTFYAAHNGIEIPFDFTPPNESVAVKCYFLGGDSLRHSEVAPDIHALRFQAEELL